MSSSPPMQQAIDAMLETLESYIPPPEPASTLPAHSVSVESVTERAVGIGERRGTETRGGFPILALKGVRLDAVARFQFWGSGPSGVDSLTEDLQNNIGAAADSLRASGFLRLSRATTSLAEHIAALNAWRKAADYRVLYEFNYEEPDGAESLIARIPIDIDSAFGESMLITDEMVRWDDVEAPALEVQGSVGRPFRVGSLSILAFLPDGWDGGVVTISALVGGVLRERAFASVRAFRDAFDLEPETEQVALGGNPYRAGRMQFPNADFPDPIILARNGDLFRIRYAVPAFDSDAVLYLRLRR